MRKLAASMVVMVRVYCVHGLYDVYAVLGELQTGPKQDFLIPVQSG